MNESHIDEALREFAGNIFYCDDEDRLEATEEIIFDSILPVYPYDTIRDLLNQLCSAVVFRQSKRIEDLRNRLMCLAAVSAP